MASVSKLSRATSATRWPAAPGAVVVTLMLTACGGGGGTQSVVAGANAICQSIVAQIRDQPATTAGVAKSAALVATEVRQLKALKRPTEKAGLLSQFLAAETTVAQRYQALADAEAAAKLARRYGISRCASAGSTVGSA